MELFLQHGIGTRRDLTQKNGGFIARIGTSLPETFAGRLGGDAQNAAKIGSIEGRHQPGRHHQIVRGLIKNQCLSVSV